MIKTKEEDLRSIREKRLHGTLIRSRARWVEEGEKPSKYFLSLENRNYVSKKMTSVYNSRGEETFDRKEISNEVFKFYKTLYTEKESELTDVDLNEILNEDTPKLSDNEALGLEGNITFKEAGKVLHRMANNRSPG